MPLDEIALRKSSFSEEDSARVEMADGQRWALRRPVLRIRPKFENGRAVATPMLPYLEGGSELQSYIDAVNADGDFVTAALNVGAYLLSFNYDLSDDQLAELFSFAEGGDDQFDWIGRIVRVANGIDAPKGPTSGGDATPS